MYVVSNYLEQAGTAVDPITFFLNTYLPVTVRHLPQAHQGE